MCKDLKSGNGITVIPNLGGFFCSHVSQIDFYIVEAYRMSY